MSMFPLVMELPPRARRIRLVPPPPPPTGGTTSACAENTHHGGAPRLPQRNYLRVRGEYKSGKTGINTVPELPPRARRIQFSDMNFLNAVGTTSACAENTGGETTRPSRVWNYLRVRGEYSVKNSANRASMELPPRARRILGVCWSEADFFGTTSACAENTPTSCINNSPPRNYLRVRGEYRVWAVSVVGMRELPPRARRILLSNADTTIAAGTTSACAENTAAACWKISSAGNYLRVRGEYLVVGLLGRKSLELPPRARRIP